MGMASLCEAMVIRPVGLSVTLDGEEQPDLGSILRDPVLVHRGAGGDDLQAVDVPDGLGGLPEGLPGGGAPRLGGASLQLDGVFYWHGDLPAARPDVGRLGSEHYGRTGRTAWWFPGGRADRVHPDDPG